MRGSEVWRWWRRSRPGLFVLGVLLFAASAAASSSSPSRGVASYGPTRAWGGTHIRSLDPIAQLPARRPSRADRASIASVPSDQVLSNEFTFSQWAHVAQIARIYDAPSVFGRVITRLRFNTEDGFPEVYLLLRAHWDSQGQEWVQLRIPGRPNGRVGWVLRDALGSFHMSHQLVVVNRRAMHMYFYQDGRRLWSAPVGIGRSSMPTPAGHFWIRERFVITDPSSGYYPYAFGTADYSTLSDWPGGGVVGIHGPFYAPWSAIPGRISHGCIRLHVPDDFWLARHLHLGTPLLVK